MRPVAYPGGITPLRGLLTGTGIIIVYDFLYGSFSVHAIGE
ncbi:hypothetical protein [Thermococcus sp.]|nr:hypothetical protein [Thermococcus sp.]